MIFDRFHHRVKVKREKAQAFACAFSDEKVDLCLFLFFDLYDLFAVVAAAVAANAVSKIVFAALRATDDARCIQFPYVGTAFVSAGFGSFSLRYCHVCILLIVSRKYAVLITL